jgi:hypothetical protein
MVGALSLHLNAIIDTSIALWVALVPLLTITVRFCRRKIGQIAAEQIQPQLDRINATLEATGNKVDVLMRQAANGGLHVQHVRRPPKPNPKKPPKEWR